MKLSRLGVLVPILNFLVGSGELSDVSDVGDGHVLSASSSVASFSADFRSSGGLQLLSTSCSNVLTSSVEPSKRLSSMVADG